MPNIASIVHSFWETVKSVPFPVFAIILAFTAATIGYAVEAYLLKHDEQQAKTASPQDERNRA